MLVRTAFFTLLFLPASIQSEAQTCDCRAQLGWLSDNLRENYPGFKDKVTKTTAPDFEAHTLLYDSLSSGIQSDTACLRLLNDWAAWFRDGHIYIFLEAPAASDDEIRRRFADWETYPVSEPDARAYLDAAQPDGLEGIYEDDSRAYRIFMQKKTDKPGEWIGMVLKADGVWWRTGQVKITVSTQQDGAFSAGYFMRDHTLRTTRLLPADNGFVLDGIGGWQKCYPGPGCPETTPGVYDLRPLDSSTLLLTLPTMNEGYRKELKQLMDKNKTLLAQTPNWIIDCRGNGGGSDITFSPLRPYLYTGKVKLHQTQLYATAQNREKYVKLADNKNFPWRSRAMFKHIAKKMLRYQGKLMPAKKYRYYKAGTVMNTPAHIAILVDNGCASSCEQFLLYARQSKKATLLGTHSAGILDYGNVHQVSFPCDRLRLGYPTSRSYRVPEKEGIDGVGIPPDVPLSHTDGDWIEFARRFLAKL